MTTPPNQCLVETQLLSLLDDSLEHQQREVFESHLEVCEECQRRLSAVATDGRSITDLLPINGDTHPQLHSQVTPSSRVPGSKASGSALENTPEVPGFELFEEIGRGGAGVVYRALDLTLHRQVAVKLLFSVSPEKAVRFRSETQTAAELRHPNIIEVYASGTCARGLYLIMELADHGDLKQRLQESPLPPKQAVEYLIALAEAVDNAHQAGILHRDLKSANVLLFKQGNDNGYPIPKIADFGIAYRLQDNDGLTNTGELLGTPAYMAPEQASATPGWATEAVDVYSLGAILYECLTGRPPFQAESPAATLDLLQRTDPVSPRRLNPMVPRDLETICMKCLDKSTSRRYTSAASLKLDLKRFKEDIPILARRASLVSHAVKWSTRNPALATTLGTLAAVLVGLIAIWTNLTLQLNQKNVLLSAQTAELNKKTEIAVAKEQEALRNLEAQTAANDALQEVLNFFTSDLFDAATTERQGVNLTVLEVLDQADAKIRDRAPDRPRVEAPLRLAIGNTLDLVGQPQKALVHLERADELYRIHDPFSKTAFDCRQVLARCLAEMGERQRALQLAKELQSPEWKPTVLQELRLKQDLLRFEPSNRSTEETVQLLSELHAECVKKLGRRDVVRLSIPAAIATTWFQAGEFEKALEVFKKQMAESEQILGLDHVDTYVDANNVAVTLIRLGRLDEAEAIHRENLRRQMMFRGPRDAGTVGTMHNLSMVLWRQNKRREAVDLLQQVVHGRAAALGPVERRTLESLYQLGRMFNEMQEYEQGFAFLKEHFWAHTEAARATREWVDMFNVYADLAVSAGEFDDAKASIQYSHSLLETLGDGYSSQRNALQAAEDALARDNRNQQSDE